MLLWVTPGINADKMTVEKGRVCKNTDPSIGANVAQYSDAAPWMGLGNLLSLTQVRASNLVSIYANVSTFYLLLRRLEVEGAGVSKYDLLRPLIMNIC
jgi:hypothetical protein